MDDYLKMTNRKKVVIRDIDPKAVSTQDLYGFVNMATREWKVSAQGSAAAPQQLLEPGPAYSAGTAKLQCPMKLTRLVPTHAAGWPAVLHNA